MPVSVKDVSDFHPTPARANSALMWTILSLAAAILLAIAVRFHVEHHQPVRDEVSRVAAPDGDVDAVLYELSGNASDSFDYEVVIAADGQNREVAEISGASRNDRAFGVNLNWLSKDQLSVEYLSAQNQQLLASDIKIGGQAVHVSLHNGVRDPDAPAGGMLFNLKEKHESPVN
jgi:hypothetical protein